MLTLLLTLTVGQLNLDHAQPLIRPRTFRNDGADRTSRLGQSRDFAFFEAFPQEGTGTFGACSTTPPTGARGEALTFTRASSAYCTKTATGGLSTTGIQPGDLVLLSNNQPRVEYDSNGVLGLRVEASRVNWLQRSEEFDNAAWAKAQFGGSGLPLVTANAGTAPDNTRTADRVWFDSCSPDPSQSVLTQATANSLATAAHSVYLKGCLYQSDGGCVDERLYDSGDGGIQYADGGAARQDDGGVGSGSISICHYNAANAAAGNPCSTCNYVATEWRRCGVENGLSTGSTTVIGCVRASAAYTGSSNTGVADVLLWGTQQEGLASNAYVTSYIPTAGASATRADDTCYRDNGSSLLIRSIAANYQLPSSSLITTAPSPYGILSAADGLGTANPPLAFIMYGALLKGYANGIGYTSSGTTLASSRLSADVLGSTLTFRWQGGSSTISGGSPSVASRYFYIGAWSDPPVNNGCQNCIVSRICLDTDPARCR